MATTGVEAGTEIRTVTAEVLTPEAFAPFGEVLTVEGQDRLPIDLYGDRIDVFRPALIHADTPIEWLLVRSRIREFRRCFLHVLGHVGSAYPTARIAADDHGLTLSHSPPPVAPRTRPARLA